MPKCPTGETYNRTIKACRALKKRGPKVGSKKAKCPTGQTYNRTLKACREMKKRGPHRHHTPTPPTPTRKIAWATPKNYPLLPKST